MYKGKYIKPQMKKTEADKKESKFIIITF
jgi:hypothetical protein